MTEKLYLEDSLLLTFDAEIDAVAEYEGRPSLILNRSAFYGEAGGQLGDQGVLRLGDRELTVVDCQYLGDQLHHILETAPEGVRAGAAVHGAIAFARRRDMMSQHTGQHLFSAALFEIGEAETVSSRLGSRTSTIDLDCELSAETIAAVADRVNDLILEDRPVRPLFPDEVALAAMKLRRLPKVTENIRVLEIEGYDLTPCGGTHCRATGEIGPLVVTAIERYKGGSRISFICGKRVLDHLREQTAFLESVGERLGSGAAGIAESVDALLREQQETARQLGEVRAERNTLLCAELHRAHPPRDGFVPITVVREHDDLESLRSIARTLARREDVVALVAGRDPKSGDWRIILERGEAADFDAGGWFRDPGKALGARGGGRPQRAEGRFPGDADPTSIDLA